MENNIYNFNLERTTHAAKTFNLSTDVGCFVINCKTSEKGLGSSCSCEFCKSIQSISQFNTSCLEAHKYAAKQAERFGGKYIYFCPLGFVHFISPILGVNGLEGAIVGGPILMIDHEEFFSDEILSRYKITQDNLDRLKRELKAVKFVPPAKVSSLSEMLYMTANYLNERDNSERSQKLLEQQSDISNTIHRIKEQDEPMEVYPISKERELLSRIAMGDKVGASKLLNDILGHIFFFSGGSFEIIKARVLELLVLLSRGALEGGADTETIFGLNYQFLNEINNFKNIEELTYWLSEIMIRFTDHVFDFNNIKHADVIIKATDFIKKNYMKKITLEEVAERSFLSPTYFSKIFNEEMKCSFINYLNQIRIENAKILLLTENASLIEISASVGFEDQSYFTKVFKKIVGVTPGVFKESGGRLKI